MKEFEHLKIHLEELKKATNNFSSKVIGTGGFGKVFEGVVSHSKGRSIVAIKRLSREFGQGHPEFLKEIMMLSRYTHRNLISLLGFCDEDGEKILVYEHASNGSLDRHLSSTALTWTQRLKICLEAARGLAYLHEHKGTQQRVLHRDIKSANILLDDNWNAKLSDMGLSKIGSANQHYSFLFTNVVGTPGYCDPQYMETYTLTKESDIYSFGVVLFEVLCGRLCYRNTNSQLEILVPMWKKSYKNKKLDQIIFKDLIPPLDPTSLKTFSDIAFQCLHDTREQRPTTSLLVKKLDIALKFQERLTNDVVVGTSRKSSYIDELSAFLFKSKGILRKRGKMKQMEDGEGSGGSSDATIAEKGAARPQADVAGEVGRELVHFDGTMGFTIDDLLKGSAVVTRKSTYGTHYDVTLENGDQVAVYRLFEAITRNQREIEIYLNLIGKIRHPNLLALRAYSLDPKGKKLLVYDYMPKGSLSVFLHARGPKKRIDWPTRLRIAKGVTRGLLSLHTHHNIIHGTLTSSNIFLDDNNNPKICDFGLSQLMTADANSNLIATARTLGYQAPELSELKEADTEADVYSLGVIMLELLTGKSPGQVKDQDLGKWVEMTRREELTTEVFDDELLEDATADDEDELMNILQLACDCVSKLPRLRPDVQQVLQQLDEIRPETTTSSRDDGGPGPSLS